MRILWAVHRYPPHIGGSEEVSRRVVDHLVQRGHDVTVATLHHASRAPMGDPNVIQFRFSKNDVWPDIRAADRAEALRYRELFDGEWDVRFVYSAQNWTLNAVWDLVGKRDTRDILAPVGYSRLGRRGSKRYFEIIEQLIPKFDRVVYHSDVYQDYAFARDRGLLDNAVVIPNGTDLPELLMALDVKHAAPDATVVTVGSHVRSKGHAGFLAACRRAGLPGLLVAPRPVGNIERARGCYYQCSARLAVTRNVRAIDGRNRHLVDETLSAGHLFFLPSTIETAPLVILEAMARGTPWVSYDVGMVRTLPGGIVVVGLGEAVETLAALANDPSRRATLARDGRDAVAERYEWGRVLPEYAALVESRP